MDNFENSLNETLEYLNGDEALNSIHSDPYWPKWHTPWWRILLLFEIGHVQLIPDSLLKTMIDCLNEHYLHFFPFVENEIPVGKDPSRHILCHCALGCMYQLLRSRFTDLDSFIPWVRPWFVQYQLPDGGLNCDEQAYTHSKKSSIVSSLPVFEAMLSCDPKSLSRHEELFLDRGAEYLIQHRLVYRTNGEIMDDCFVQLQFPRFYAYDILRGLTFLDQWRKFRNRDDADETIEFGLKILKDKVSNGQLTIERSEFKKSSSLSLAESKEWVWGEAKTFPLLDAVSCVGHESTYLTKLWSQIG